MVGGRRGGGAGRRLEGDPHDGAQALGGPDADDAGGVPGGAALAVADDPGGEAVGELNVPLGLTRSGWACAMSQWGVSVEGFIRPWTAAVHSVTNQVRGLPPEDFGRPWPLTATVWPGLRPWLGVTLTTRPGVPACAGTPAGSAGDPDQGGDGYGYATTGACRGPPNPGSLPGSPGRRIFPPRPARFNAPRSWSAGRTPATGRSANLNAHPFGGGVIGNTTGSGPVIEGSSPSPRAPAASVRVMETTARPHRLEA